MHISASRSRLFHTSLAIATMAGSLGPSAKAEAYIIPPSFMLKQLFEERLENQKIEDLTLKIEVQEESGAAVEGRAYVDRPDCMRLVWGPENNTTLQCGQKVARGVDGNLNREDTAPLDLLPMLLYPGGKADAAIKRATGILHKHGIDTSVYSLARLDGIPCYVIGALPWEKEKPQLWLYKDSFLPAKWQYERRGKLFTATYRGYGAEEAGPKFPQFVEYATNGEVRMRISASQPKVNSRLPKSLFSMPEG